MKAILEFDLPEEEDAFTLAVKGGEFYSFLFRIKEAMRGWRKYGHKFKTANAVIDFLLEELSEIDFDCVR